MSEGQRRLLYVDLAQRFPGHWPWELEDAPADRLMAYLDVLGVEAYVRAERQGLGPDDAVTCYGCFEDE